MKQNQQQVDHTALMVSVIGQIGCLIFVIIALFLGAGVLLDKALGTDPPVFTILSVIASVPVTMFAIFHVSLRIIGRVQQQTAEQKNRQEEENSL